MNPLLRDALLFFGAEIVLGIGLGVIIGRLTKQPHRPWDSDCEPTLYGPIIELGEMELLDAERVRERESHETL